MAQAYFSLVTTLGRIKLAASAAGGDPVVITHFAVGDGNGAETNPTAASTALVREVWRTPVESVVVDPDNPSAVLVTAIIPTAAGGWWMREFGIFDEAGAMIAVARPVSQYKPTALEGQLEDIRYEFQIIIGDTANVTLLVDPSLLFATREWVMTRKIPMAQMMRTPWLPVISMTLTALPAAPAIGDTYVVPAAASGAWSAQVGKLAEWTGAAWSFLTPPDGHGVSLPDGRVFVRIAGTYVELLASEAKAGLVRLATTAEALAGIDATKALTPAVLSSTQRSHGQCQLRVVNALQIKLWPYNGNIVRVAGISLKLPAAGVAVANTGVTVNGVAGSNLAASSTYLVALNSAGTLEYWSLATGHTLDATPGNAGVEIISGRPDKTLVGMVFTTSNGQFAYSPSFVGVISWFNRRSIGLIGATTPNSSTASIGYVELHSPSRVWFCTWADESVDARVVGQGYNGTTAYSVSTGVGVDGVFSGISGGSYTTTGGQTSFTAGFYNQALADGAHYIAPMGTVGAGGTGIFAVAALVNIRG